MFKKGETLSKAPSPYITQRKRIEGALQEREERYRDLLENANDLIQSVNSDGRFLYVNHIWRETLGYTEEEISRLSLFDIIHPESQAHCREVFQRVISGENVGRVEAAFVAKDGRKIIVEGSANCKFVDGKPVATRGIFRDITQRKKAEEEIKQAAEEWRTTFDSITDLVFINDTDFRLVRVNKAFADALNMKPEELVGKTCYQVVHGTNGPLPSCPHVKMLETKEPAIGNFFAPHLGIHLEVATSPLFNEQGEVVASVHVARDITQRKRMEEELRSSEERLKILFEFAPDGYYLNDLKGNFVDGNKAAEEITGYKREELIGKSFLKLKLLSLGQIPKAAALLAKNALRQATGPDEFILNRKDGGQVAVAIRTFPVKIEGKTLVLSIARDITERKQAEEALRQSEEKYRTLFELSPIGITALDMKGVITACNPAVYKEGGYSKGELVGKHFSKIAPVRVRDILKYMRIFSSIMRGKAPKPFEVAYKRKDGTSGWTELHVALLKADGRKLGIQVLQRDVTERKQAEEEIRKLSSAVEQSTDGIVVCDLEQRLRYVNNAFARMHGYTPEEMIGMKIVDLHGKEQMAIHKEASNQLETQGSWQGEIEHVRKDGTAFPTQVSVTLLRDSGGKPMEILVITRDITQHKQVEEELMEKTREMEGASQAKSSFLASMSHELRTPLNSIIGFSELMLDGVTGEINDEQRECLGDILSGGQYLLNLINDVLDLSRIEAGKLELRLQSVNLADVVNNVVQTIRPMLDDNRHQLTVSIDEGLPQVRVDRKRLRQIFLNLLGNAIKFTPSGGELNIEAGRENNWCQVSVVDEGIGIRKEDQERIFEAFTQGEILLPSGKREGSGLGLTLTRQFVEMMGGRIWMESQYGKGSKFTFSLPLASKGKLYLERKRDGRARILSGKLTIN